ncbi:MAG TPA: relaxase domain-containing protein, partial [Streptosporangiaceae bacterium]|nr:relaxase domain-containing protein [Streptosporangiaceae bacterium]
MAVVVTCKSGDDLEYVWINQPEGEAAREQPETGYYIDSPDAEAPGQWWLGRGAGDALGLETGQQVDKAAYLAVYKQVHPLTGEKMGSSPGSYSRFEENLARKLAAEPHATEARKQELRAEAHKETRMAYPFTDVTVSFSKDVSCLGAGIRENLRQARESGDSAGQAYWQDCLSRFQDCLQGGNRAALEYLQEWGGITRTGHHGTRVDGKEPGRFEDAALVVSSWLQGTSRAGDPQEHVHNQVARLVRTLIDGAWRTKDGNALRAALPGMAAVAAVHTEAGLAREFGLTFRPRADGRGMRIDGTPQWLEDLFSSRTVSITERMPEAIAEWSRRHDGAVPNQAQVFAIRQQVTLFSRDSKQDGAVDWDAHAQEWDTRSSGALAQFPAQVSNMRGPDGGAGAARNGRNPGGPPERTVLAQAARDALETVQRQKSAWTRAELLKAIAVTMPPETRQMDPDAAVRLLERMADNVIASVHGDVVSLEAPEFLAYPESMRRGPDRRTVYERPGAARYATSAHLDAEHALISHAQRLGGW